jgi:2-dehydro-3-deoxyphosphogluconate aldolase/(4S)-4-hydroxy-2-oxoglutarate aldolase
MAFASLTKVLDHKIIPVVAIHDAGHALPLADALIAGGLPCAEITFRTAAAADAIKALSGREDILVGAGTVLKIEQVQQAVDAGATFIVSPGFNPKVVGYCVENGIPVTPGVSNPTDIEMALEFGLEILKFFPAEAFGGLKTLKAMSAPYTMMRFIPTGGIGPGNVRAYLEHPKVAACGGSWMVKSDLIAGAQFARITELTREAVAIAAEVKRAAT